MATNAPKDNLLPIGASPEDQAAQSEAWTAAVAYAALLHDIGKIAVDLHVELADGSTWHPWHGPLHQAYRFHYRDDREYRLHSAATGLLYRQLLDRHVLDWLSDYPALWAPLLYVLAGQYEHAGVLGELVVQADRTSVAQELGRAQARNATQAAGWVALPDWLGSHACCFAFLGGVPEIVVPDNLRSAVSKSHRYEPDINPSYRDLAEHYGVAVVPARARKPRDKAKAEVGVQVVERWILAALRNRQFFSLDELNSAIALLLKRLNRRPFRKLPGSRYSAFEALDRPALRPLPEQPYVYAEWKKARVGSGPVHR